MLVLTRKMEESVMIGNSDRMEPMLRVTVLGVVRGKVRLGFEAADEIAVHRSEVWDKIRKSGVSRPTGQRSAVPAVAIRELVAQPRLRIH
jgi:carbon storage regulator CsrA